MKPSLDLLADTLSDMGAIKFGAFRLKLHETHPEAPLSPVYVDLRLVRSFPNAMKLAIETYRQLVKDLDFDIIVDVPTAGTPFASILSFVLGVPMVSPRKTEKGHGLTGTLDGSVGPGQVALLVDDLITRADSKLEVTQVLNRNQIRVHDVVVLIDREQGGAQTLAERGMACHSALTLRQLVDRCHESGRISAEEHMRVVSYLLNNAS